MDRAVLEAESGLARRLGLGATTLAGIGVILGAGIYVLVGVAAAEAGNAVWLSFLFAAVAAGLTGVSYGRLGRLRPKNAPEFQYLGMAFGRPPAFLAGWLVLWATILSATTVALGFAGYLSHLAPVPTMPVAIGLMLLASLVVFLGIGQSALMAGTLTLIECAGLVFIIAVGIPSLGKVDYFEMPLGISGVVGAASLVFFAYLGFEGIANLSEEMKDPERDLPRAVFLAIAITTAFYILVAVSAVSVVGWRELSQSGAPLAVVAARALGPRADLALTYIALASTANTVLLMLLAASRAMWAMSCAGALPGAFCVIGPKRRTPWVAILVVTFFASAFAAFRNIETVAQFSNFATLIAFVGVNAAVFKIFTRAGSFHGVRALSSGAIRHVLLDRLSPLLGVAVTLLLAANTGLRAAFLGGLLLLAGALAYVLMGALGRRGV